VSQDDLHTGRGGSRYYNICLSTYDKKTKFEASYRVRYDMHCGGGVYIRIIIYNIYSSMGYNIMLYGITCAAVTCYTNAHTHTHDTHTRHTHTHKHAQGILYNI